MYFPYFRGKQFEFVALSELAEQGILRSGGPIVPIIEPVRTEPAALRRLLTDLVVRHIRFGVVMNPSVGQLKGHVGWPQEILGGGGLLDVPELLPMLLIHNATPAAAIPEFLGDFPDRDCGLIHLDSYHDWHVLVEMCRREGDRVTNIIHQKTSTQYQLRLRPFRGVSLADGFSKAPKNAMYPPDEYFSDLPLTYREQGFIGFSDYMMVGEDFIDEGGPAYAVAIHLTYLSKRDEIWIRHFISDRTSTQVDPGGKFLEALRKLAQFVEEDGCLRTVACQEFLELYQRGLFRGLGYVKKLSIRHHLELIANLLGGGESL